MCKNARAVLSRDAKFVLQHTINYKAEFRRQRVNNPKRADGRAAGLWLVNEFHFDARDFDQVVIGKLSGLPTQGYAVDGRKHGTFHVGDEKTRWATCDHRDLNTRFADCRKVLCKVQSTSSGWAREHLYR